LGLDLGIWAITLHLSFLFPTDTSGKTFDEGLAVEGPTSLHDAAVTSRGDHRVAMGLAVAGLTARSETSIGEAEAAAVSFPEFGDELGCAATVQR
jgi:5-enolpyruvylshikimate-3-phosphate synthase